MYRCIYISIFFTIFILSSHAQLILKKNTFGSHNQISTDKIGFIENIGQFNTSSFHRQVNYSFNGFNMPALFTQNGIVFLQRKVVKNEKAKEEREGEKKYSTMDKEITMQWIDANPNVEIIPEELSPIYHTYGLFTQKARLYKRIIYKNLYPNIDLIYSIDSNNQKGFEYSFLLHPGADISNIKLKFEGDVKSIFHDSSNNLVIKSSIDGFVETKPNSFYLENEVKGNAVLIEREVLDNIVSFKLLQDYDKSKIIIIDPFITPLGGLTGVNSDKAYDIDYDYEGNIYARGGGDYTACELAKYNKDGVLQWVFHGTLTVPAWSFGFFNGGWVVEKGTGKILIGQGQQFAAGGFRIIRLNSSGIYDNYITTANSGFVENWRMLWICNNGSPEVYALGGGISSNLNLSICTPPSTNLSPRNIVGISNVESQDIADGVIDPETNDLYTIFASTDPRLTFLNNRIYKHKAPYTTSTIQWNTPSGYTTVVEAATRPYLVANACGSVNSLALNKNYLFFWDGKNLKAFNKTDGTTAGTPLAIASNIPLMQGGIVADDCDNIFVGDVNGTIKVYKFNGSVFDDLAAPDITITGFPTSTTYALSYDFGKRLLYACGQGFVSSFDVSTYCSSQVYNININADCITSTLTATLSPNPPAGSTITYSLYNGSAFIASNTTGVFTAITPNVTYTVKSAINFACSGVQFEKDFTLIAPLINAITTASTCTQNIGTITVTGSLGVPPYTYSIDGANFQTNNVFSGLAIGNYTITIKDAIGCKNTKNVTVPLSGTNTVTLTAGANATICEGDTTQINAISNANTFSWTPTIGLSNPNILNPKASPIITTKYYITATSTPCFKLDSLIVFVNPAPIANAGKEEFICNGKDAQLDGSGGLTYAWSPSTYLDDPNSYNPKVIKPLGTITYSLQVTDNLNCKSLNTATVKINVRPPEKVSLGNDTTIAINQPLKLNVIDVNNTGFNQYLWSPSRGLNSTIDKSPTAILDRDITYNVIATTPENCSGTASIKIKVFEGPEIYVPNAFTPNGDSKNDILFALPIGLKEFRYFAIYNKYGERVFYTNNSIKGWDGKIKGKPQNTSSFVWMAEGIGYRGNIIFKNGTVTLIR